MEKEYRKDTIRKEIEIVYNPKKSALLNNTSETYRKTLANLKETINNRWHILDINNTFGDEFKTTPIIAFSKKHY